MTEVELLFKQKIITDQAIQNLQAAVDDNNDLKEENKRLKKREQESQEEIRDLQLKLASQVELADKLQKDMLTLSYQYQVTFEQLEEAKSLQYALNDAKIMQKTYEAKYNEACTELGKLSVQHKALQLQSDGIRQQETGEILTLSAQVQELEQTLILVQRKSDNVSNQLLIGEEALQRFRVEAKHATEQLRLMTKSEAEKSEELIGTKQELEELTAQKYQELQEKDAIIAGLKAKNEELVTSINAISQQNENLRKRATEQSSKRDEPLAEQSIVISNSSEKEAVLSESSEGSSEPLPGNAAAEEEANQESAQTANQENQEPEKGGEDAVADERAPINDTKELKSEHEELSQQDQENAKEIGPSIPKYVYTKKFDLPVYELGYNDTQSASAMNQSVVFNQNELAENYDGQEPQQVSNEHNLQEPNAQEQEEEEGKTDGGEDQPLQPSSEESSKPILPPEIDEELPQRVKLSIEKSKESITENVFKPPAQQKDESDAESTASSESKKKFKFGLGKKQKKEQSEIEEGAGNIFEPSDNDAYSTSDRSVSSKRQNVSPFRARNEESSSKQDNEQRRLGKKIISEEELMNTPVEEIENQGPTRKVKTKLAKKNKLLSGEKLKPSEALNK